MKINPEDVWKVILGAGTVKYKGNTVYPTKNGFIAEYYYPGAHFAFSFHLKDLSEAEFNGNEVTVRDCNQFIVKFSLFVESPLDIEDRIATISSYKKLLGHLNN